MALTWVIPEFRNQAGWHGQLARPVGPLAQRNGAAREPAPPLRVGGGCLHRQGSTWLALTCDQHDALPGPQSVFVGCGQILEGVFR